MPAGFYLSGVPQRRDQSLNIIRTTKKQKQNIFKETEKLKHYGACWILENTYRSRV